MKSLVIREYESSLEKKWDEFVLADSFNGTFLQTRRFLNYHPEGRFSDASLIVYRGTSDILAVIPGCIREDSDGERNFISHLGSTFGGLVVNKRFYDLDNMEELLCVFENYMESHEYRFATLKQTSQLFCERPNDLIEYLFYQRGWSVQNELSFVIDLHEYARDILSNFRGSRRREYKKAEESGLVFKALNTDEEIAAFYGVLCENLRKFNTSPVHSLDELYDFRHSRLENEAAFYGVCYGNTLIAGSMVFMFEKRVFHTQYLASLPNYNHLFPSIYLDGNLITLARDEGFDFFSFGISTEDRGRVINHGLARFKEGFGTTYCNNKTFVKRFSKKV